MKDLRFLLPIWAMLTLILVWPAYLNGGPIVFFDSLAYLNAGNVALEKTLGLHTDIFMLASGSGPHTVTEMAADPSPGSVDSSRSIYYALLLLLVVKIGGFWAAPLVQAGVFAAALASALMAWLPDRPGAVAVIGAITAGLTGAPFFTSYMMPDFLAGLGVLAVLRLMLPPPLGSAGQLAWAALLYVALVSHMSHLLVAIGLFACALVAVVLARLPWPRTGAPMVVVVLALVVVSEMLFGYTVTRTYGTAVVRPPFLAARMIADGPGQRYLEQVCPAIPQDAVATAPLEFDSPPIFELCHYRHRLPQDSLTILWDTDPARGIFGAASPAARQRMSEQHFAFAGAVVSFAPSDQIRASLARFGEQLAGFSLNEFRYTDFMRARFEAMLHPDLAADLRQTRFFQGTFPLRLADICSRALTVLSAIMLVALVVRLVQDRAAAPQHDGPARDRMRVVWTVTALVLLALLGNAAVTGILSAPHDRYQARIYWLLPMVAGLVWVHVPLRRASRRSIP